MTRRYPPLPVWVDVTGQFGLHSDPGVLLAWRQVTERGRPVWECLVMYAGQQPPMRRDAINVYQQSLPAHLVRPMEAERPKPDLSGYKPVNGSSRDR